MFSSLYFLALIVVEILEAPKAIFFWLKRATSGSSFSGIEKKAFGVRDCNE
jgi:hypothetical protein